MLVYPVINSILIISADQYKGGDQEGSSSY